MAHPTDHDEAAPRPATTTPGPAGTDAHLPIRERLSRERIVAGAIGYVGRHCLADLSMRRLGSELGVEAMSLYRYFPSKAALFDALVDSALSRIAQHDGSTPDWESAVRCYARSIRDFAREQPRLFPLLAAAGPSQRSVGALMERMLVMWRRAGLDDATARNAQLAVHAFTIGTITAEIGVSFGPPEAGRDAWCRDQASWRGLGAAGSSAGAATAASGSATEATFAFALDVLIEGLRDRFDADRVRTAHG